MLNEKTQDPSALKGAPATEPVLRERLDRIFNTINSAYNAANAINTKLFNPVPVPGENMPEGTMDTLEGIVQQIGAIANILENDLHRMSERI